MVSVPTTKTPPKTILTSAEIWLVYSWSSPMKEMITFEDFEKLDIRIGKVVSAERIPEAEKLIKLEVDLGEETRQLVAGIAGFVQLGDLVGKELPVLVNLVPRKLRGVESQGMILAVDVNGEPVLLHPEREVPPGSMVK